MQRHPFSTRTTTQDEPIPGTSQVQNEAGGFCFPVDAWTRLDRFLVLGCEGGTYYATEKALKKENALAVLDCIQKDGRRVVTRVVEMSQSGRIPKNDTALFVLAMAAGASADETRRLALDTLPLVARTGTHLFHFVEYAKQFRGWGRGLRQAIAKWYTSKTPDELAYQVVKYGQRDGWSHRDLIRLAHPSDFGHAYLKAVYQYALQKPINLQFAPRLLNGVYELKANGDDAARIVRKYGLPMEAVPSELRGPGVYEALADKAGQIWLYRNLGNLAKHNLLHPSRPDFVNFICQKLVNGEGRVHPIQVLSALMVYGQGHGEHGRGEWLVVPDVLYALNEAFVKSFHNVAPTGKRWLLGLDVSGSMADGEIAGIPGLTPRMAAAAMALVTLRTEADVITMAFQDNFVTLPLHRRQSIEDVIRTTEDLPFGATDCAIPMLWALYERIPIDVFVVYTDNETWAGEIHPVQALRKYREQTGIPARLVVVGLTSNGFTVADPEDAGMLDVVGFDAGAIEVMGQFARGEL